MTIIEALKQLDPKNADHWTGNGAPDLKTVQTLLGDENLKRKDITDTAPLFTRERAEAGFGPEDPLEPALPKEIPIEAVESSEPETPEQKLKRLNENVALCASARAEAVRQYEAAVKDRDDYVMSGEIKQETFAETINSYKEAQQRMREHRAGKKETVAALRAAGVFDTQAPIDAAMARRSQRGGERPKLTS